MSSHLRRNVLAAAAGSAHLAFALANPANALDILPTFSSSITGASDASAIESAIDTASSALDSLFSNSFNVPILFEAVHDGTNGFIAGSESSYYADSYSGYASLLKGAAAANPANTILNAAVANLRYGNKGGTDGIVAANTVFQALGVRASSVPGEYNASGSYVGPGGAYDGVILINIDQPLTFTQPVPTYNGSNLTFDGARAIEHEIDEVLGGGGSGSTLNDIAEYGKNNPYDAFTYYEGPLDLYRYSGAHVPSFSTSSSATAYFSVNGGVTDIVGFNQYSQGDFGDFGPTTSVCAGGAYLGGPAGLIQDAFTCNNQTGEKFTSASPEYKMLEALGYDPAKSSSETLSGLCCAAGSGQLSAVNPFATPELSTWAMMALGFAGLGFAGYRRARVAVSTA